MGLLVITMPTMYVFHRLIGSSSKKFLQKELDLEQNPLTTQIENHDWIANFCLIFQE